MIQWRSQNTEKVRTSTRDYWIKQWFSSIASLLKMETSLKGNTNPWHHEEEPHNNHETPEDEQSKATSSLFPIKMIEKLEWTQSNAQQNREQL